MHWRRKWQPTPVFLPGESQGRESLVGCCLWGPKSRTRLSDLAAAAASVCGVIYLEEELLGHMGTLHLTF